MSHGLWKCKQKDKLKGNCTACGNAMLLHPLLEKRRGWLCPNCLRKKTNWERFGMEEPPKNVKKADLIALKNEMEALKDAPIEEYRRVFEEKVSYLIAHTPQALGLLEHSKPGPVHPNRKKKQRSTTSRKT